MQIKQGKLKLAAATLTGLFILEVVARCLVPSNSVWLEYARHAPSNFVRSGWTPNWKGMINIDGIGGQKGAYEFRVNSFGFRGQTMVTAQKEPNTFRIFFMGGSFVEEMAIPEEKTFPALIEKKLSSNFLNKQFECINAGISGFMSPDLIAQFEHQILNYQPDLIILTVPAINDLRYGTLPEYNPDRPLPPTEKPKKPLLSYSRSLYVLYRFAGRYQHEHTPYWKSLKKLRETAKKSPYTDIPTSKAHNTFIKNIYKIIQLAKNNNIRILLASEPSIYQTPLPPQIEEMLWVGYMRKEINLSPAFLEKEMSRFNAGAQLLAEKEGVDFIDLAQSIPKSSDYFYDDLHLTPLGSQKVAEILTSWLINNPTAIK